MTKPIEDSTNASAIRTALDVPTNAALNAKYTKPANGIPAADLEADPAGRVLLTATSAAERKQVLGLDQVDNTSDANKPVSTAQATAIGAKMGATLPALQSVFNGGTAAQKADFQSSVSGYLGNPRILAIGDSITNDGWLTTASPQALYSGGTYTAGGVTDVRTEDHGFIAQASAMLGVEIVNKGIAGNTIQQVINRLATDVAPYKPGIVIDNAVTNSLFGPAADAMTEDQLFDFLVAQKTTCIEYYRGISARVVIPECLPRSSFTTRQNRVAARYNRWLRTLPELQNWIRVVPVAALFSDPAVYGSTTPAPRWTRDGVHPNNVGAMRYGRALVDTLGDWVQSVALYPSLMDVRGGFGTSAIVRNTNPLMGLGSGGTLGTGATGSIAAEYTINRLAGSPNIACSLVTDADGYQRQRLTVDFLAAGDAIWFGISPASGVWDTSRASLMSCAADVDIVSGGPEIVNALFMFTAATVGGTAYRSTCLNQNTQSVAARGNLPTGRGAALKLRSPRIYVPVGACTTYQTQVRIYASAAGQVSFDIGRFYKLQEVSPS